MPIKTTDHGGSQLVLFADYFCILDWPIVLAVVIVDPSLINLLHKQAGVSRVVGCMSTGKVKPFRGSWFSAGVQYSNYVLTIVEETGISF